MSPRFSVLCITYQAENTIRDTLRSILAQEHDSFEVVVQDNASTDRTAQIVASFKDPRLHFHKNPKNIGIANNIIAGTGNCTGEFLFLMAADDILATDALAETEKLFRLSPEVGAVTRPYYWFDEDLRTAVRFKDGLPEGSKPVVKIGDDFRNIRPILSSLDQMSALAFRMSALRETFSQDFWAAHAFPFLRIMRDNAVAMHPKPILAVRIGSSITRGSVYDKPPMVSWIETFQSAFPEPRFEVFLKTCIREFIAINYVGLVQIRNFGKWSYVLREIGLLIRLRPKNLLVPGFWFYSFLTLLLPPFILKPLSEWYKKKVLSGRIGKIDFRYPF
ncbi:MAG: glycosyltransferase family 2 protein [Spirochaetia bacterium]|nr:glycosyltransferase family 2 protein [Spirochaetia bacterium]